MRALALLLLLGLFSADAFAQRFKLEELMNITPGTNGDHVYSEYDAAGNYYIYGKVGPGHDFDPDPFQVGELTEGFDVDVFIAKYDPQGNLVWVRGLHGDGVEEPMKLHVDGSGKVYAVGVLYGTYMDLDPDPADFSYIINSGEGSSRGYVVVLDQDGNYIWGGQTQDGSDSNADVISDVDVDSNGLVFLTGVINSQLFLMRLDPVVDPVSYELGFEKYFTGSVRYPGFLTLSVHESNVILSGNFFGSLNIDPDQSSAGELVGDGDDAFVAYYNNAGQWTGEYVHFTGAGLQVITKTGKSPHGEIWVAGAVQGSLLADGHMVTSNGDLDAFVAKIGLARNVEWVKSFGNEAYGYAMDVAVHPDGIFLAGLVTGTIDLDPGPGVAQFFGSPTTGDAFVLQLDQDGQFLRGAVYGSVNDNDYAHSIDVSPTGGIRVAGWHAAPANVDFDLSPSGKAFTSPANPNVIAGYNTGPIITDVTQPANNIWPPRGTVGSTAVIQGFNFSTTPEDNAVYFGATRGVVTDATQTNLTVQVPSGSTHEPVSVAVNGLSAAAITPFYVTFNGYGTIPESFSQEVNFSHGGQIRHSAAGDFDNDGKPDVVVASADQDKLLVYRNDASVSDIGENSLVHALDLTTSPGYGPYHVAVGDLNGDGRLDVAAANFFTNAVSVFLNTTDGSGLSFSGEILLHTPGNPRVAAIYDLDGDGRADLITGNADGTVSVFANRSTSAGLNFTHIAYTGAGGEIWDMAIGDIDGDFKPEILTVSATNFEVFRNLTSPGNFVNGFVSDYVEDGGTGIALGDFNLDGKTDVVKVSGFEPSPHIRVYQNTSAPGSILLTGSQIEQPDFWGVTVADINGDGRPDIVAGISPDTENPEGKLLVLSNTPVATVNISHFESYEIPVGGKPLGITVVDLDGDTRNDLIVSDEFDNVLSVYRHLNSATAPSHQPSNLVFSEITSHSLRGEFTPAAGEPAGYIVIRRDGDTEPPTAVPQDGVPYPVGHVFEDGSVVVYSGNQPYFNASGLSASATFAVFAFNGAYNAVNYNENDPLIATAYLPGNAGTSHHHIYHHWTASIGSAGDDHADVVATGRDGQIYAAGRFIDQNTDFDPGPGVVTLPKPTVDGADVWVAGYSNAGALLWATSIGGSLEGFWETAQGIDVDDNNNVYVLGKFAYDIVLEDVPYYSRGGEDLFIVKYSPEGVVQWVRTIGSAGDDDEFYLRNGFKVDGAGNVYIAGEFAGTAYFDEFGAESRTAKGGRDMFVAKYNTHGDLDWVRQIGGNGWEVSRDLALAPNGDVLYAGQGGGGLAITVEGSPDPLYGPGEFDIIFGRFDAAGNFVWAHAIGGPSWDFGEGISADSDGSVYISGSFNNHADFDPDPERVNYLTSASPQHYETFVAKYDAAGSLVWARSMNSTGEGYGARVKADGVGGVYVVGIGRAVVNADGNGGYYPTLPVGEWDVILYKYSTDGFLRWSGAIGSANDDYVADLAITPERDVVVVGDFAGDVYADPADHNVVATGFGGNDGLLIKYGPTHAQPDFDVPYISQVSPLQALPGSFVTINGYNFDQTPENNIVFFGATQAVVTNVSPNHLEVQVPVGATYGPVTVTVSGKTASSHTPFVPIYLSVGTMDQSSFDPAVNIPGQAPRFVRAADLDGDGRTDLVFTSQFSNLVTVAFNEAQPQAIDPSDFSSTITIPVGPDPAGLALADLDGDGKTDIVVSSQYGEVSVIRNQGGRFFSQPVVIWYGADAGDLAVGDLNRDGRPDIAVVHPSAYSLAVLRNQSTPGTLTAGSFVAQPEQTFTSAPGGVAIGQVMGDHNNDIIVSLPNEDLILTLHNLGGTGDILPGNFQRSVQNTAVNPNYIRIGDLNGDQLNDVLVNNSDGFDGFFSVLKNLETWIDLAGVFHTGGVSPTVTIGDLTGDGHPDIVSAGQQSLAFRNFGNSSLDINSFGEMATFGGPPDGHDVIIADMDSDGKPDVVFTHPQFGHLSIFRNRMEFGPPTVQASNVSVTYVTDRTADFLFTAGDGNRHLFVMKQGETVDAAPEDGSEYHSVWTLPSPYDLGDGNYVVATGAADWTSLNVIDLQPATQYSLAVFAFNDLEADPTVTTEHSLFMTDLSGADQNPITFYTLDVEPTQHPGLSAQEAGTSVLLTFSSASGIGAGGYVVLRREDGVAPDATGISDGGGEGVFTLPVGTTLAGTITDPDAVHYVDNDLAPFLTYHYTLIPFNWAPGIDLTRNYLTNGPFSIASATTTDFAPEPLNPPAGPFTTTNVTASSYSVQFSPADDSPTGYIAVRMEGEGNIPAIIPSDQIPYSVGSEIEPGSNQFVAYVGSVLPPRFEETGLSPASVYNYRIYSFNGSGASVNYRTADFLEGTAYTLVPEPLEPATNFTVTNITATGYTISFDPASESVDGYLVVRKKGSAPTIAPTDGTTYSIDEIEAGSEEYVVFTGAPAAFPVTLEETGLDPATTYHYRVYTFNGSGSLTNYLTGIVLDAEATTLPNLPSVQASNLTILGRSVNSVELGFIPGDGDRRIVVVSEGGEITAQPQDGSIYTGDGSLFGGTMLPDNARVVYILDEGVADFDVSGLSGETQYTLAVFEFNDINFPPGSSTLHARFLTELAGVSGNPVTFHTMAYEPLGDPSFFFATASGTSVILQFPEATTVQADRYLIYRSTAPAFPNTADLVDGQVAVPPGSLLVADVDGSAVQYIDTDLTPGVTYNYAIIPYAWAGGEQETINYYNDGDPLTASATPAEVTEEPATPPTNFLPTAITSESMTISFNQSETGADGYIAIRKAGAAPSGVPADGIGYALDDQIAPDEVVVFVGTTGDDPETFSESGLEEETEYFYRIYAYNGTGTEINYLTAASLLGVATTLPGDQERPVVVDNTVNLVPAGTPATISARITDEGSGVAEVGIHFRMISSTEDFQEGDVTEEGDDVYSATIPATSLGELGIEYYFYARDNAGNELTQDDQTLGNIRIQHPDNGLTIPYNSFGKGISNYRIVAVPLELENRSISAVFGDDLGEADKSRWRMFRYQSGNTLELSPSTPIDPGKGYWLIAANSATIDSGPGNVVTTTDDGYAITLTTGWNQIGNPYNFNISWQDVVEANPGMNLPAFIRVYNTGTFADGTRLNRFEGGFINVGSGGNLIIPKAKNPSVNRADYTGGRTLANSIDDSDWEVRFSVRQGALQNLISGVGMRADASAEYDPYDGFSMPRFLEYLDVNHNKSYNGFAYSMDIVPTTPNHVWEFSIHAGGSGNITINWDNAYFRNSGKSLVLWDVNLQLGIDMKYQSHYEFDPEVSGTFKVVFGDPEFANENTRANTLVFHGIMPNPVTAKAMISFAIPEAGYVSVELVDITGKQGSIIFEGALEDGQHQLEFDNSDYNLAPGVYVARIRSGVVTAQKRIVLRH